jgi:hypothetical protein
MSLTREAGYQRGADTSATGGRGHAGSVITYANGPVIIPSIDHKAQMSRPTICEGVLDCVGQNFVEDQTERRRIGGIHE